MMAAETCTVITCDHRLSAGRFGSEPVRHCLRDEAKEVRPHARPQAWKTQGVFAAIPIHWGFFLAENDADGGGVFAAV